jgi:FlaG/FlaF family flagellin (archaellin)
MSFHVLRHAPVRVISLLLCAGTVFAVTPRALAVQSGCGAIRTFSGNGGKSLGTLTFGRDTTMSWTNDGMIFSILASEDVPVNSQAHRGTTVISKGVLHKFQINAMGNWKITLTPRCAVATSGSHFSGNGGKNLGTIVIAHTSIMSWTNDGMIFSILTDSDVPVNSQAHKGTTVLDPGRYQHFQINAMGNWTITIKRR